MDPNPIGECYKKITAILERDQAELDQEIEEQNAEEGRQLDEEIRKLEESIAAEEAREKQLLRKLAEEQEWMRQFAPRYYKNQRLMGRHKNEMAGVQRKHEAIQKARGDAVENRKRVLKEIKQLNVEVDALSTSAETEQMNSDFGRPPAKVIADVPSPVVSPVLEQQPDPAPNGNAPNSFTHSSVSELSLDKDWSMTTIENQILDLSTKNCRPQTSGGFLVPRAPQRQNKQEESVASPPPGQNPAQTLRSVQMPTTNDRPGPSNLYAREVRTPQRQDKQEESVASPPAGPNPAQTLRSVQMPTTNDRPGPPILNAREVRAPQRQARQEESGVFSSFGRNPAQTLRLVQMPTTNGRTGSPILNARRAPQSSARHGGAAQTSHSAQMPPTNGHRGPQQLNPYKIMQQNGQTLDQVFSDFLQVGHRIQDDSDSL